MVAWDQKQILTTKKHERTFWNDGNVLYLGCGGGDDEVYKSLKLSNCILRVGAFHTHQLCLNNMFKKRTF